MTVASATNRTSYSGNGSTTAFAFAYPFRATSDLVVTVRTTSTGAESLQTEGTHYTVTGTPTTDAGGYASGTVTFVTAPASGTQVHIDREPARTQTTDYIAGDGIPPSSIEGSLDRLTLLVQDLESRLGRTLMQPRTAANRSLVLPEPSTSTASKFLAVNTAGTAFEMRTGTSALVQGTVYETSVSAAPSTTGSQASISTAFTGDLSKQFFPVKHTITGAATAGQPTTGYSSTPEIFPFNVYVSNASGWNEATASNDGRTGIAAFNIRLQQGGQGDLYAVWAHGGVNSTRSGSTVFLANPAAVVIGADLTATVDGGYLNPGEWLLTDNGTADCAAVGWVVNMNRTVTTGAKGAYWAGYRAQSIGSSAVDVLFSGIGKARHGLDLSFADFSSNSQAAITLKAGQLMYFNATATDSFSLSRYPSALGSVSFGYNSGSTRFDALGADFNIASTKVFRVNGTQVVSARDTGWTAMTGSTNKATSYDTSTVTLAQLAGRVMAIQAALTTHGLLGA